MIEMKSSETEEFELSREFLHQYGIKVEVSRVALGTLPNPYFSRECVVRLKRGERTIILHEYLKTDGGLTDRVELIDGGIVTEYFNYLEAERDAARRLSA